MFGVEGIILGFILIAIGGFLLFFFPGTEEHQPNEFGITAIVLGILFIIIGGILIFL